MSNKTNCSFKKSKKTNTAKINMKNGENFPLRITDQNVQKILDFHKKAETYPVLINPSENINYRTNKNIQNEKKNIESIYEE